MSKRILVIDDDPDILEILNIVFEQEGYEVILSADGNEAEHIEELHPDLVLLDIRLIGSGKNGADICAKIKSSPGTKDLPVILLSSEDDVRSISEQCGANEYVSKPFMLAQLLTKVHDILAA
jgi:two-component system, OmpR family, response regulator VicR